MAKKHIYSTQGPVSVGNRIRIIKMDDKGGKDKQATAYNNREGVITKIDDSGQLHGTWGGLAVIPEKDVFIVLN